MRTQSAWATADVHLSQSEHERWHFEGFPNLESYQVLLTHPWQDFTIAAMENSAAIVCGMVA